MIKPNIKLNNNAGVSYYSLVVAIAKRAREIANEAELKGEILIEKPVDLAVDQFLDGEFKINESKECSGKPCCESDYAVAENLPADYTVNNEDSVSL